MTTGAGPGLSCTELLLLGAVSEEEEHSVIVGTTPTDAPELGSTPDTHQSHACANMDA